MIGTPAQKSGALTVVYVLLHEPFQRWLRILRNHTWRYVHRLPLLIAISFHGTIFVKTKRRSVSRYPFVHSTQAKSPTSFNVFSQDIPTNSPKITSFIKVSLTWSDIKRVTFHIII